MNHERGVAQSAPSPGTWQGRQLADPAAEIFDQGLPFDLGTLMDRRRGDGIRKRGRRSDRRADRAGGCPRRRGAGSRSRRPLRVRRSSTRRSSTRRTGRAAGTCAKRRVLDGVDVGHVLRVDDEAVSAPRTGLVRHGVRGPFEGRGTTPPRTCLNTVDICEGSINWQPDGRSLLLWQQAGSWESAEQGCESGSVWLQLTFDAHPAGTQMRHAPTKLRQRAHSTVDGLSP
jgi:hypothetical protein